ncbi:MAG: YeeE/YedE family protein [Bdellovibrionales bacterium]|nr:YeeE/YedE family protein [Bdellovibrionales bacterium]
MTQFLYPILGGVLIGLSAAGMLWSNGKVLGVSGIVGGALRAKSWDLFWRIAFILGMIVGALLIQPSGFSVMSESVDRSLVGVAVGGLLVGFGTTISNGCTSGHGICGISRLSPRSIVATSCFIATGILAVTFINIFFGGKL